ncbi:MAG: hypothetical protein OQL09_10915, partial [Gammaproteobacteria bacterium]|nr:hypothetical protein [Gammaproteobacteria bacterium]
AGISIALFISGSKPGASLTWMMPGGNGSPLPFSNIFLVKAPGWARKCEQQVLVAVSSNYP